jgi:hypothetical protein
MDGIKRNLKDSIFVDMFNDTEYLKKLYKDIYPFDEELKDNEISITTIENTIANSIYNDLGFMVRGKLMILVEAQSTWSENIIIRFIMYLSKTWREYLKSTEQNIYKEKPVVLPKPEFYVVYTGDKKIEKEYLDLSKFFNYEGVPALEAHAKVLHYNSFERGILREYITFCKVLDKARRIFSIPNGTKDDKKNAVRNAVDITIRYCIKHNILTDYLGSKYKEVKDMMVKLLDEEEIRKAAEEEAVEKAVQKEREEKEKERAEKEKQKARADKLEESFIRSEIKNIVFLVAHKHSKDEIIKSADLSKSDTNLLLQCLEENPNATIDECYDYVYLGGMCDKSVEVEIDSGDVQTTETIKVDTKTTKLGSFNESLDNAGNLDD